MIEILYCENGQHNWERKSKRGKKPKNCPDHMPKPIYKPIDYEKLYIDYSGGIPSEMPPLIEQMRERKLICEHDGHEWWAPVQRGRPPRFCPEHRPPAPLTARQRSGSLGKERTKAPRTCGCTNPAGHEPNCSEIAACRGVLSSRELYCHAGDHTWQAERKRGKPPRNCPKHSVIGAVERKGELAQEKKEKAQKTLQDEITRLSERVDEASSRDKECYDVLRFQGGINNADEETFNQWIKSNTALLHEVEALRARERKLIEL